MVFFHHWLLQIYLKNYPGYKKQCMCVFLGVFFLLRDWIMFVAGGGGSVIVFPHKHLSWDSAIKEQYRWAGVHMQMFFVNYVLPLGQNVHCVWWFLYSFYFLSSNGIKCFQFPHSRVACLYRSLSWEGRPLWFLFFLQEWVAKIE